MRALVERTGVAERRPGALAPHFRALVAISHPFARAAMVSSLELLGARQVTEAASIAEARVRAGMGGPRELVVLDLHLPDGSGLALLHELRASGWVRSVVLSGLDDPYTVRGALAAGVRSFLVYGDASASGATAPGRGRGVAGGALGLSARELEVLQLVADGNTNKAIGGVLGLSALTVKSHLARIARKLGTGDRAEMVLISLRAGVIS